MFGHACICNMMGYNKFLGASRKSQHKVSSTIPEMFVNSNTLHFNQTNVLQSHVCLKLLQMLTFKKYIKINAKPCKYVHLKFDYLTFINFQIK